MNWYYVEAGQQAGPVDDATLEALVANGTVASDTLVWCEGMANWQPYSQVKPARGTAIPAPPIVFQSAGGTATATTTMAEAVCAECGGVFPVDETISYGNVRVCANCKPLFVQKLSEGLNVSTTGTLVYAGFWTRFAAYFLDVVILWIVNTAINFVFGFGLTGFRPVRSSPRSSPFDAFALAFALMGLGMLVAAAYESFFIGKFGATPGKMACKIKVVVSDGSKVSYGRAIGRYFAKFINSFTCLIGYIVAAFDAEKRALHDRMCNTRVVMNRPL